MRERIIRHIIWIMVARNIHQRLVQKREYILEVGVRQISAAQDQFDIAEMPVLAQTIEPFDNFIAHRKDFHSVYCALEQLSRQGTMTRE